MISAPHEHDVIFGRGNGANKHPGNVRFRQLVKDKKLQYVLSPRPQRPRYPHLIVDAIKRLDPPGRFLRRDATTEMWYDVDEGKALEKARQALSEGSPIFYAILTGIRKKLKLLRPGSINVRVKREATTAAITEVFSNMERSMMERSIFERTGFDKDTFDRIPLEDIVETDDVAKDSFKRGERNGISNAKDRHFATEAKRFSPLTSHPNQVERNLYSEITRCFNSESRNLDVSPSLLANLEESTSDALTDDLDDGSLLDTDLPSGYLLCDVFADDVASDSSSNHSSAHPRKKLKMDQFNVPAVVRSLSGLSF